MSSGRRKFLFWLLLSAFLVLGFWWISFVPYRPGAVFSAIPAGATFVSSHRNLAEELSTVTSHPAARAILMSAGIREEEWGNLASNRETRAWIQRLASKETVLAYVPSLGFQRQPAWVFASWIGGESQSLQWKLRFFNISGLRPVRVDLGRTIWMARAGFLQPGEYLSLALTEGMVLGCVSSDPAGVRWLLETSDGYPTRPSVATSGILTAARALVPTDRPHWGWCNLPVSDDATRFMPGLVGFSAAFLPTGRLDLELVGNQAIAGGGALASHPDFAKLAAFLGTSPDLVTVMPLAWTRPLLLQSTAPLWAEAVGELIDRQGAPTNALAFLALLNREHSGRVRGALGKSVAALVGKGLRVPTLMVGVQLDNEGEATARVNRMIGQLNARYGWSLETHVEEREGHSLTLIAESRRNFYGKFNPEEQVACVMVDKWLILASNAAILRRLLHRNATPTEEQTWTLGAADASALAWADLAHCGKTLKETVAVAQLASMVGDSQNSTNTQTFLETARDWIGRAQHLEQAAVSMRSTGAITKLNVVLGR